MKAVECLPSLSYDLINFRPHFDHARIHAGSMFLDPGESTGSAYYKIDNERRCHMKILHAIHGCLVHTFAIIGAASSIDAWRTQPTTTVCFQYGFNHIACTTPPGHLHPVKHTSFCFWALLYCLKRMSLLTCHHIWFGLSTVPFNFMRGNLTARLPWTASIVFQYPSSLQLFAFRRSEKMRHQSRSSQHRLYDAPITRAYHRPFLPSLSA
jgi:hypothetical protein